MSKHYYISESNCVKRLLEEYKKYGTLYVAFDFDNTIYDYHNKGIDCSSVISLLQDCTKLGFKMILFTCGVHHDIVSRKKEYCQFHQIKIDYINESPILNEFSMQYFTKPYYNILLDDRAGLQSAMQILKRVIIRLKIEKNDKEIEFNQTRGE